MVKEIALRKESGEVETFGVDWSNPHEMAADSAKSSGPGRNRVDPPHWSNSTLIPDKSWQPLDNSRRWEIMKEFKI